MSVFSIDWDKYRLIDLSYQVVPGASKDRYFDIEQSVLVDNAFMHHVRTHTHVGTHVELDAHFFEGGRDLTGYELADFMGRALLLEVHDVEADRVDAEYLDKVLGHLIGEGDIIICRNSDPKSLSGDRTGPR